MKTKFEIGIYANGHMNFWSIETIHADSRKDAIKKAHIQLADSIKHAEESCKTKDILVLPYDEILPIIREIEEKTFITGISEITEEKWYDMLEVLPPEKWCTVGSVNIFRMLEYITTDITAHYMRFNKRYFTANYRTTIDYTEIANNVKEFINHKN